MIKKTVAAAPKIHPGLKTASVKRLATEVATSEDGPADSEQPLPKDGNAEAHESSIAPVEVEETSRAEVAEHYAELTPPQAISHEEETQVNNPGVNEDGGEEGTNQANAWFNNSSAARTARRRLLRETYFGSSGSDNNVSRRGSTATVIDWNTSPSGDFRAPFTNAHNVGPAGAQPTGKKGATQVVSSPASVG